MKQNQQLRIIVAEDDENFAGFTVEYFAQCHYQKGICAIKSHYNDPDFA